QEQHYRGTVAARRPDPWTLPEPAGVRPYPARKWPPSGRSLPTRQVVGGWPGVGPAGGAVLSMWSHAGLLVGWEGRAASARARCPPAVLLPGGARPWQGNLAIEQFGEGSANFPDQPQFIGIAEEASLPTQRAACFE